MWPNTLAGTVPWLDALAVLITQYGTLVPLLISAFLIVSRKDRKLLAHAGLTFALAVLIDDILGALFFRVRPFTAGVATVLVSNPPLDSGFPSGHAARAFALSQPVLMKDRVLGIIATVFAVLVAISRVYVGVHYWSDVIAGALISIGCAYAAQRLLKNLQKKS